MDVIRRSADLAGAMTLGAAAMPAQKNAVGMGIRAYHGTPHNFDRFEWSPKTRGTGEGAQAYGDGLYFAENERVARSYRDNITGADPRDVINDYIKQLSDFAPDGAIITKNVIRGAIQHRDPVIRDIATKKPELMDYITRAARGQNKDGTISEDAMAALRQLDKELGPAPKGHMYEVNINANPDEFLDWDAPLPTDHPVRGKIADYAMKATGAMDAQSRNVGKDAFLAARNENLKGEGAHYQLTRLMEANRDQLKTKYGEEALFAKPTELTRRELTEVGIPGIRFRDAGSRGKDGDGTRNYVVFDDKLISIVRKYGIAAAIASGVITQQQATQMQAQGDI
jgi:hypothetical protein